MITQRCRPPRSFWTKKTLFTEHSLSALKKRLQLRPERSFKIIRYVPSSPSNGTNRNRDVSRLGSMVIASEVAPRHCFSATAFKGPMHLLTKKNCQDYLETPAFTWEANIVCNTISYHPLKNTGKYQSRREPITNTVCHIGIPMNRAHVRSKEYYCFL